MFPQLIIVEDDSELSSFYRQGFADVGFEDIVAIESTERVVDIITKSFTRPTLLVSDYCVPPIPPSRYLPDLRLRGVEIPAVVVSGRIRADQINDLTLAYPVRGFFEKTPQVSALITAIAKHLIDLGPEAAKAWETYQLRKEMFGVIEKMNNKQCTALLSLLAMAEVKVIAAETEIGLNAVYDLRKDMLALLGKACSPSRYGALAEALRTRLGQHCR